MSQKNLELERVVGMNHLVGSIRRSTKAAKVRGVEGVEIETPKAPSRKGKESPLSSRLGGHGSVVSSPNGVQAAENGFW